MTQERDDGALGLYGGEVVIVLKDDDGGGLVGSQTFWGVYKVLFGLGVENRSDRRVRDFDGSGVS